MMPNPAHALDGGIPSCFHIGRRCPAASDVHRWALMRTWAFRLIGLLAMLLGLLQLRLHGAPRPVAPSLAADVTMNQDAGRGGALYITLRLADGKQLPFIVDTGSPITLLDKSLEPELGRRIGAMPIGRVGQAMRREALYAAPKLYLDKALLTTGSNVATREIKRAMGILGMDCLQHYCIQLDFEGRKVRFLNRERVNLGELGKAFPTTFIGVGPTKEFIRPLIHHAPLVGGNTNLLIDTGCVIDALMEGGGGKAGGPGRVNLAECIWDGEAYTDITVAAVGQANALGLRFLARHLVTFDFPGGTTYLRRQRSGPLTTDDQQAPNEPGGANGGQPFASETNRTSAAAAPRRSP